MFLVKDIEKNCFEIQFDRLHFLIIFFLVQVTYTDVLSPIRWTWNSQLQAALRAELARAPLDASLPVWWIRKIEQWASVFNELYAVMNLLMSCSVFSSPINVRTNVSRTIRSNFILFGSSSIFIAFCSELMSSGKFRQIAWSSTNKLRTILLFCISHPLLSIVLKVRPNKAFHTQTILWCIQLTILSN